MHSNSQFRRSGQRDTRRRRLFAEEQWLAAENRYRQWPDRRAREELPPRKSRNYGDAEFMDEQPRLTDLIPRKPWPFVLVLLVGIGCIVGLELLYAWMPTLAPATTDGRVAALDLDGEGSLAVWFSSVTLLLCAASAWLVFMVRRHKIDDYQGHYRVWLWAAACWVLMSLDETASLHEGFKEMMAHLTGTRLFGDGSIWWVVPYFFLLGAVGSRLLVDMWACRLSSATLLVSAGCYAVAVVAQLGWVLPESGARGVMLEEGAEMLGGVVLFTAMLLHARYVVLDAEGLLPEVVDEEDEDEAALEAALDHLDDELLRGEDEWLKVEPAQEPRRPVLRRRSAEVPEEKFVEEFAIEPEPEPIPRKLSKAERKALRRRQQQEQAQKRQQQQRQWSKAG